MSDEPDHEFTPEEIRSNRLQALIILFPMLVAAVVAIIAVLRAVT